MVFKADLSKQRGFGQRFLACVDSPTHLYQLLESQHWSQEVQDCLPDPNFGRIIRVGRRN